MKRLIGTKQFYKETTMIALPIMAQQFITAFVSLIDNIMIGSVGGIALTSVTVANKIYILYNSTLFGFCGAAGIYLSQYLGAKKEDKCQEVFDTCMSFCLLIGILFVSILFICPEFIVHFFTTTPEIVNESLAYIEYAKFSYLPYGISFCCMMSMRCVGITKLQLKVGSVAVLTNTFFNYCFIFGNFGFPELGVQGAAIATVIARCVEMIIYVIALIRAKHFFCLDVKKIVRFNKDLVQRIFHKAAPLTVNEIFFSLGQAAIYISYMRCDEYLAASISVVDTVVQILFIIFAGLSSAVSIMIGKRLGAGELKEAKDNAIKLLFFGWIVAIILCSINFVAAAYIPYAYNLDLVVQETITILLRVKGILLIFYVINVCVFFILRAGGDIVSTLLLDSGFLWAGGVFVSTMLSMFTGLPLVTLYMIVEGLDIIKMFAAIYFFQKGRWIKNITE
ncbi:MATE family efflux transporter [Tannockella kyphosi]|uniref:MATE family efflux transporter n=1 Tax=Tannockella kyphosi TaxID=2899121 RepID=UPI002013B80E|nr:MATE family efflux transporter [Tannockella kyphosi]